MTKEELIKRLEESAVAIYEDEGSYDYMFKAIADEVKSSDLVEVIRCKDCRWYAGEGMYCTNNILVQFDHFFCYYGERNEDKK